MKNGSISLFMLIVVQSKSLVSLKMLSDYKDVTYSIANNIDAKYEVQRKFQAHAAFVSWVVYFKVNLVIINLPSILRDCALWHVNV